MSYDATKPSGFSLTEAEDAVGRRATLPLTGQIVEAGESPAGSFVKFALDPEWGFGPKVFTLDLDALLLAED
jgi:hypothetical protein